MKRNINAIAVEILTLQEAYFLENMRIKHIRLFYDNLGDCVGVRGGGCAEMIQKLTEFILKTED